MYTSHGNGCKALTCFGPCTCRFTVLHRNEVLGTSSYSGTYETLEEAQESCRTFAKIRRNFATFQPHTGTPSAAREGFGKLVGEEIRGER
jgi:hypothetical protein